MILVLGGTTEARELVAALTAEPVVTSLAGRLPGAQPTADVRVGGFGGADGLADWLQRHEVTALVDATHPFARQISEQAVRAAAATGVPLLRLERPGWQQQDGDEWHRVPDIAAAARVLPTLGASVLATTGHTEVQFLNLLVGMRVLLRCITAPDVPLAGHVRLLLARGPFPLDAELALLRDERIDVVLTKDSGGSRTKLDAAAQLGLPVVLVERPAVVGAAGVTAVATVAAALDWLASR